jgi:hypothetical protein
MRLNRDAQIRAVDLALPLMPDGGRIVFVTSHYAHFYRNKPVLSGYTGRSQPTNAPGKTRCVAVFPPLQTAASRWSWSLAT